jgi:phenylpropionate dioxygenase-like ring-hydroxylating dioxygenase large terminal subunit
MQDTEKLLHQLARLANGPLSEATAMPPGIYHDPDIFALERDRLFARGWLCAGLAAEIPNPGDYLSFSINDQPIFILRGEDGAVRALANVCRHRMMRLVAGSGHCSRLVCPYHGWTYALDGQLLAAPHMKRTPGFLPRDYRLAEIRSEIWQGWIFVTLDRSIPSIADELAPLAEIVAPYDMAGYLPIVTQDHLWNTNWKLLTENFMESYHLPVAHRRTVGAWFPAEETAFPAESFPGFTFETFTKSEGATYGRAHPANTRLTGSQRFTSVMPTIFPSHMIVLAPDHLWYLSLRPKSVGEVHVRFGAAVAPEVMAGLNDREAFIAELVAFFDRVNDEDRMVVEGLFQGTGAPLAVPGRLSWLEREIHDFMGYLSRGLASSPSPAL